MATNYYDEYAKAGYADDDPLKPNKTRATSWNPEGLATVNGQIDPRYGRRQSQQQPVNYGFNPNAHAPPPKPQGQAQQLPSIPPNPDIPTQQTQPGGSEPFVPPATTPTPPARQPGKTSSWNPLGLPTVNGRIDPRYISREPFSEPRFPWDEREMQTNTEAESLENELLRRELRRTQNPIDGLWSLIRR